MELLWWPSVPHHRALASAWGWPSWAWTGCLIPGKIVISEIALEAGKIVESRFVPERGGVVTSFDKYQYGKDPRLIYNLPGRFERVSKKQ